MSDWRLHKHYTAAEKQFLRDNWKVMSDDAMAEELGRTIFSVEAQRTKLGLVGKRRGPAPKPKLKDRFLEARRLLADLLLGGAHDGPCDNMDDPGSACSLHLAASDRRKKAAAVFLSGLGMNGE